MTNHPRYAASAPTGIIELRCMELNHSSFDEPFRVVCDWQDWTVTLETDEEATFKAGQFRTARPKQDDSGRIERPLRIDAADPSIVRKLLALTAMQETVQCTFRIYLSDDLTAPVLAPEITSLGGFSYAGTTLTASARSPDLVNRKFGRKLYTTANTPGLYR
ncbi:MAG TPA: DUF1833 family protein [Solimonas sp.]